MYFPVEDIVKGLKDFYINTKGPTNWPPAYRGGWDSAMPCAWDGNERAHPPPAGTRCTNGGWNPLPPRGPGGLMFLIHTSGMAEGPIPKEFQSFMMIDSLILGNNKLTGEIWNTSYHCFLHKLDLSHNRMSGPLGADFMQRNHLHSEVINLEDNSFDGPIPAIINTLKPLTVLLLNDNKFEGTIPDFSHLSNLRHFSVARNKLSGTIGPWIKELKNLGWLELDNNAFEGALPPELPPSLTRFSASYTKFSGTIPESYGKLGYLRHFNCTGCTELKCPTEDLLAHLPFSTHCKPSTSRKWPVV